MIEELIKKTVFTYWEQRDSTHEDNRSDWMTALGLLIKLTNNNK